MHIQNRNQYLLRKNASLSQRRGMRDLTVITFINSHSKDYIVPVFHQIVFLALIVQLLPCEVDDMNK